MTDLDLVQGSDAWLEARVGSLGASRIAEAVARTKTGWGASRANLMAEMVAERLTGTPADRFTNAAMQWGTEKEPEARAAYEFLTDVDVALVGIVRHPTIAGTHASPDGLVGDDGLVEIKAPNSATHIDTLLGQKVPEKYVLQMNWQMACTGRRWCDFASYDPRLPEAMRLFVKRVERDDALIATLEKDIAAFLAELEEKVASLRALYGGEERAAA
ncbi:putative phage-type endonuclease [Methylorubrum rhodesianum]|uniref:lambda-exonuclease family protein n=1 Tax=Methylorubrum rhodesianum TaxID=29427 RepID=UPI001615C455|nr:YqaJ viral recombinase family protein [Methylorubrum rhodesianum]MBB5762114.1 putative phage-type endonuclease [Methylorubrum rhodesianum]